MADPRMTIAEARRIIHDDELIHSRRTRLGQPTHCWRLLNTSHRLRWMTCRAVSITEEPLQPQGHGAFMFARDEMGLAGVPLVSTDSPTSWIEPTGKRISEINISDRTISNVC